MRTTATLHIHPKVKDPIRVFEVRYLANTAGCLFVNSKPKPIGEPRQAPLDPNNGGRAA